MKNPTGYAPPRQLAKPRKQVQLNLRRARTSPDDERETEQKSYFWWWFGLVAFVHIVAISLFAVFYQAHPVPPPQDQFMSLLPEGDVVKGTPGAPQAPKVGQTTLAHTVHHTAPPPAAVVPPAPAAPAPKPIEPQPVVQPDAPDVTQVVAPRPAPVKPVPPKPKPKVKVDLNLVDGPTPVIKPKPKPHIKKPVVATTTTDDSTSESAETPDNTGLSKEEIAEKLASELKEQGVTSATNIGHDGAQNSHASPFADFYLSVRDQVMSKWEHPNLDDQTAVNPEVKIHVEKDGRVPPESVTLTRSSGNRAYDDSALAAARSLGYLLQPLPDGCPPDISINFKLTR